MDWCLLSLTHGLLSILPLNDFYQICNVLENLHCRTVWSEVLNWFESADEIVYSHLWLRLHDAFQSFIDDSLVFDWFDFLLHLMLRFLIVSNLLQLLQLVVKVIHLLIEILLSWVNFLIQTFDMLLLLTDDLWHLRTFLFKFLSFFVNQILKLFMILSNEVFVILFPFFFS